MSQVSTQAAAHAAAAGTTAAVSEEAIMKKVMRRLIPFILLCYVVSYLDRINVGFAALTMNKDLGLTPSQFGLARVCSSSATSSSRFPATWRCIASARACGSRAS